MTIRLITGGQTGVDTGAAKAGLEAGVNTLCYFPNGMKREQPLPDWMKAIATALPQCPNYQDRTRAVVKAALATLIIQPSDEVAVVATKGDGTSLTIQEAKDVGNQVWRFMNVKDKAKWKAEAHAVAYWLRSLSHLYGNFTLMVAGPRGGKWEDGEKVSYEIVLIALKAVKEDK